MRVKPVLGGFEVPHIASIETAERRDFVELRVPGMTGSLLQDLAAQPTCVEIRGSVFGDDDKDSFLNEVRSRFAAGDPVDMCDEQGRVIARGLVNYDAGEIPDMMGRSTRWLSRELGPEYERELVHRDDLVVLVRRPHPSP